MEISRRGLNLPRVGIKLRETREAKNLTLKDVEQATNIRRKYLEALETGEYDILPGTVYAKGFIRNYSEYLGLNPEEILSAYKQETCTEPQVEDKTEPVVVVEPEKKVAKVVEGSFKEKIHKEKQKSYTAYILAIIVIILGVYFGLDAFSPKEDKTVAVQNATLVQEKKNESAGDNSLKSTGVVTKPQGIALEVQAIRRCWVFVVADGKKIYEGVLEKDAKTSWQAKEKLTVKLGDATALKLELNKKSITIKARDGEVIEREFTLKDI